MITDEEFREALAAFIKRVSPAGSTLLAKVQGVDEAEGTCVLTDDSSGTEAVYPDVRLRPVEDGSDGITQFPETGTWALAVRIEESEDWLLLAAGNIYKYRVKTGPTVLELTQEGATINGSGLGGMVKVEALTQKLNAIESDLNALKTAFKSWIVVPQDGGAALKASASSWAGQTLTATQKTDLENPKVKQG
jgi:hypothetical protein